MTEYLIFVFYVFGYVAFFLSPILKNVGFCLRVIGATLFSVGSCGIVVSLVALLMSVTSESFVTATSIVLVFVFGLGFIIKFFEDKS